MTTTLSGIAEELERLDKLATPGPWEASEDAVGGDNDYKTLVQVPSRTGMFGTPVVYCHHNWEEDRISWKQAEANAALIALIRSNLPAFIEAATLIRTADDREKVLREAAIDTAASLAAAISLLERGGKAAKKAAPSDRMFDRMLADYRASLERARKVLGGTNAK